MVNGCGKLRREHGLSQAELAGKAGVSLSTLARLEAARPDVVPLPDPGPARHSARGGPGIHNLAPVTGQAGTVGPLSPFQDFTRRISRHGTGLRRTVRHSASAIVSSSLTGSADVI